MLETPLCSIGCDQVQPRLVQDIRGLRGSAPYHWDGTVGDQFGGINTASHNMLLDPNFDIQNEESCTLHLVDGSLATTMCDLEDCETKDEGKPGKLSWDERAALAKYLLSDGMANVSWNGEADFEIHEIAQGANSELHRLVVELQTR